jgi:DNA-binding MarR family transcriptional regulator
MNKNRENLVQTLVQRMMSVMRHVRHTGLPPDPGLTPPQGGLLFAIAHKKDGVSVKELAEGASVTPGAITQFVDALVEKGFVVREQDPNDRRIVRLKLTQTARNQFEKVRKTHLESFTSLFEVLNDDEITQLIALITKIDAAFETKENKKNHSRDHFLI